MRWLLDANVILDVFLDRQPHAEASGEAWKAVEHGEVGGVVAAHVLTTVYYIQREARDNATARREISLVARIFTIAAVDFLVIERALSLAWPDFEDAVSAAAAERAGCDLIVTGDPKGFRKSHIPVHTPETATAIPSKS